jgi:hypothetical protein
MGLLGVICPKIRPKSGVVGKSQPKFKNHKYLHKFHTERPIALNFQDLKTNTIWLQLQENRMQKSRSTMAAVAILKVLNLL